MNLEVIPANKIDLNINLIEVTTDLPKSERIDRFLAGQLPNVSRSRIQTLIDQVYVTFNDALCNNKKNLIKAGDRI